MMRTQREMMKGQRSDMNLRAVEQERELKRQRTSKVCGKQPSCCLNRLQSANYFDRRRGKSKQREWGGLFFWSVGHSCYPLERWIIWRLWSWAHRFAYNCLQFHTSHGHQHGGNLICISLWGQLKTLRRTAPSATEGRKTPLNRKARHIYAGKTKN